MGFKSWFAGAMMLGCVGAAAAAEQAVVKLYNTSCISCHMNGAANAPRTGNAAQWKPRLDKGMDTLLANVKGGIGGMPPGGMCFGCSDEEIVALINYMAAGR